MPPPEGFLSSGSGGESVVLLLLSTFSSLLPSGSETSEMKVGDDGGDGGDELRDACEDSGAAVDAEETNDGKDSLVENESEVDEYNDEDDDTGFSFLRINFLTVSASSAPRSDGLDR